MLYADTAAALDSVPASLLATIASTTAPPPAAGGGGGGGGGEAGGVLGPAYMEHQIAGPYDYDHAEAKGAADGPRLSANGEVYVPEFNSSVPMIGNVVPPISKTRIPIQTTDQKHPRVPDRPLKNSLNFTRIGETLGSGFFGWLSAREYRKGLKYRTSYNITDENIRHHTPAAAAAYQPLPLSPQMLLLGLGSIALIAALK